MSGDEHPWSDPGRDVLADIAEHLAQEDNVARYDPLDYPDLTRALAEQRAAVIKQYTDRRIREALIEEGVDPDAVERVARRARAGEFDPLPPTVTIREDHP